ncbi:MAG: hypothetical protein R2697_07620 [Ilumatobacteraceae bacterium]
MKWTIGAESDAYPREVRHRATAVDGDEDATATINYTRTTAARPKGVQLTHRNIWLNATVPRPAHERVRPRMSTCTRLQFHCNGWGIRRHRHGAEHR